MPLVVSKQRRSGVNDTVSSRFLLKRLKRLKAGGTASLSSDAAEATTETTMKGGVDASKSSPQTADEEAGGWSWAIASGNSGSKNSRNFARGVCNLTHVHQGLRCDVIALEVTRAQLICMQVSTEWPYRRHFVDQGV